MRMSVSMSACMFVQICSYDTVVYMRAYLQVNEFKREDKGVTTSVSSISTDLSKA